MARSTTTLKKLGIKKFRALRDVEISFGNHVTVICGKNGTSKSSILGIAAQIFSFEKDYVKETSFSYQTIAGEPFKSLPKEHFRFSKIYDIRGSLDVEVEVHDGYTQSEATAELELSSRGTTARPVVRKNTTVPKGNKNKSRNFTHPVIFLSLKRLQPIASRDYGVENYHYLSENMGRFIDLSNELLNKTSSVGVGTGGDISSAVAHGSSYDQDSVSAGEDNAGQIILAIMSFEKLKKEYADYKGGLLLIDEADAGLFPAAQTQLIDMLNRLCTELQLQVVMTSHSPTLIQRTYDLSQKFKRNFKTVYLSDTYGPVQAQHDISWSGIYSDLHTQTMAASDEISLPVVNVYFEDNEAYDFFKALTLRLPAKKFLNPLSGLSLGCSNYIQLIGKGIPEFAKKSVIVLDADAGQGLAEPIILLPGHLPPDQLIFEFLYNLPAADPIWQNARKFTRPVLTKIGGTIRTLLSLQEDTVNLAQVIQTYRGQDKTDERKQKLRQVFKTFYKTSEFQDFLTIKGANNPWRRWLADNATSHQAFRDEFSGKVIRVMAHGFSVDVAKINAALN